VPQFKRRQAAPAQGDDARSGSETDAEDQAVPNRLRDGSREGTRAEQQERPQKRRQEQEHSAQQDRQGEPLPDDRSALADRLGAGRNRCQKTTARSRVGGRRSSRKAAVIPTTCTIYIGSAGGQIVQIAESGNTA